MPHKSSVVVPILVLPKPLSPNLKALSGGGSRLPTPAPCARVDNFRPRAQIRVQGVQGLGFREELGGFQVYSAFSR